MIKILCLDTTTEACSAALMVDGVVTERYEVCPREHSLKILPMVQSLLAEAKLTLTDLDAIACTHGPGSFTGVRLGIGVAQGLAYGANLPLISVSSLAALAWGAYQQHGKKEPYRIVAALDARMHEVYLAVYDFDSNGFSIVQQECLMKPEDYKTLVSESHILGCGHGFQYPVLAESMQGAVALLPDNLPHAKHALQLALIEFKEGKLKAAKDCQPLYLRNQVVHSKVIPSSVALEKA